MDHLGSPPPRSVLSVLEAATLGEGAVGVIHIGNSDLYIHTKYNLCSFSLLLLPAVQILNYRGTEVPQYNFLTD